MDNYWYERNARSQRLLTNKNIKEVEEQLIKYYGSAAKSLISLFEEVLTSIISKRFEGSIPSAAELYNLDKYWKLQGKLQKELQSLGDKQSVLMLRRFTSQYKDIYENLELPKTLAGFLNFDEGVAKQVVNSIWCKDGLNWSQRIWNNIDKLHSTLNEELMNCVITGRNPAYLKKVLEERFSVSYSDASNIVTTEMAHIQTVAAAKRYQDIGVEKFEFIASPSERTCSICGKLDGKVFSINDMRPGENCAPVHPRCRCCIAPVVKV